MNKTATLLALSGGFALGLGYTNAYAVDLAQLPVVAGQAKPTAVSPANQASKSATLRLLDKQTNRVENVVFEVGKPQKWGTLTVSLGKCAWGVAGVAPQDAAWLDITAGAGEPEFHGWMFNTFPGVSTFEHPRYDVQLKNCARPQGYVPPAPGRVAPATPTGPDHDNTDDEAPRGVNQQFVVPGISDGGGEETSSAPAEVPPPAIQVPGQEIMPPTPMEQTAPTSDEQQLQRMMDLPSR